MGSVVVTVLSITIGLFFILVGTIKITPVISEDVYKEMRKTFIKFSKVFPLISWTGWKPSPHVYRRVIATSEIVCGLILTFIPGRLKQVANVTLLVVLALAVHGHYMSGDALEKMTSSLVFGLLLLCRFIVRIQVRARENREKDLREKGPPAAKKGAKNGSTREKCEREVHLGPQPTAAGDSNDKKSQ